MGTVLRESQAFPYWDFEIVRGKSYAGYIYRRWCHRTPRKRR